MTVETTPDSRVSPLSKLEMWILRSLAQGGSVSEDEFQHGMQGAYTLTGLRGAISKLSLARLIARVPESHPYRYAITPAGQTRAAQKNPRPARKHRRATGDYYG